MVFPFFLHLLRLARPRILVSEDVGVGNKRFATVTLFVESYIGAAVLVSLLLPFSQVFPPTKDAGDAEPRPRIPHFSDDATADARRWKRAS